MTLSRSIRRGLVAGGAVLVLGGAAVGIAAAQAAPTTTTGQQTQTGYQKFVDALAKRLGIQSADLATKISQARADAGLPAGNGFPGGERGGHGGARVDLAAAATALNLTPQQLMTELQGKSLADVAKAHNVPLATVTNALKDAAHKRIDAEVAAGKITADQATQQKTAVDQRIDQSATQIMPVGGRGRGGKGGGDLGTAATFLNITPQQLMTELNGKTLADVAVAHGKTAADLAAALKKAAHDRIDAAVTAGKVTADQAAQQKTQVDQRIDQQMTQVHQPGAPGADGEDPNG